MKASFIESTIVVLIVALDVNVAKTQKYVLPTKPAETGKAPGMKVKLLDSANGKKLMPSSSNMAMRLFRALQNLRKNTM